MLTNNKPKVPKKWTDKRYLAKDCVFANDARFLALFHASPVPFGITDTSGKIHALNAAFVQTIGYDLKEIESLDDWWPKAYPDPDYRQKIKNEWAERLTVAIQNKKDFEPLEVVITCKNKKNLVMFAVATPLAFLGEDAFLVTFVDVSDVKRARTKIEDLSDCLMSTSSVLLEHKQQLELERQKVFDNEERMRLALEGANDGLWDYNAATDTVYYSPRYKSMLGYADDELENKKETWEQLLHSEDKAEAKASINRFLEHPDSHYQHEFRMLHKQGHFVNILSRAFAVKDSAGNISRIVGTHVDISNQKAIEAKLQYQSSHDSLTGLINRREFEKRADELVHRAQQQKTVHALCYLDLDQFKLVNDTCGHIAGDELLCQLSRALEKQIKPNDTLARLGGDEFGVLMQDCTVEEASYRATLLHEVIRDYQFVWEKRSFRIGSSIGLVVINQDSGGFSELLKKADAACFMAKDKGRDCIHIHDENDVDLKHNHGEMEWASRITTALDENKFCLYCQEIQAINGSAFKHYELLIRLRGDDGKTIPPGAFLPAAERFNLAKKIDRWVIDEAIKTLAENKSIFNRLALISINLSGQSLVDESLADYVIGQLEQLDGHHTKICFEITETATISNLAVATIFVNKLKQFGCKFALDDFGSGLSSFGYLKNLSVDYLKIDGIFVKDIVEDPIDRVMVKSITDTARVMGLKTVAEFVENDEIKAILQNIGVDYAQGYGVHVPEAFENIIEQLKA
ncbi:EAL domain-containing protein [Glaciecola siphonariae]|uniref:EAL domain-containing protein n=1 Tax=Glaciecola siphonariae TaxID=521012 RepID=A0ABV9LV71_9ALTE